MAMVSAVVPSGDSPLLPVRRAIACDDLPLERPIAVATPALQQAGHHAHGLQHLGVAQTHVGEGVVARGGRARFGHRPLNAPLAEHGERDEHDRRDQCEQPEIRVENENGENVDRRPKQIEDGVDARPGHELPVDVEIAQRLAGRRGSPDSAFDGGGEHAPGEQPIEPDAGPRQHARAHEVESRKRAESDQEYDREHQQRDMARAVDHPVVDLEHIERACEIKQVDREAEDQRGDEIAPASLEHHAQLIRLRCCKHAYLSEISALLAPRCSQIRGTRN
jgi:hypothetical protein